MKAVVGIDKAQTGRDKTFKNIASQQDYMFMCQMHGQIICSMKLSW
jgi:hypothetical protein